MASFDTLDYLDKRITSLDYLGFSPTSNGVKPPHIANGLFRLCTGEIYDISDIHSWIVSEEKENAVSSETIIREYPELFERGWKENPDNVRTFRFLLYEILNQDNTVYPTYDFSVVTQSSHWMIKKQVKNEFGTGEFIFAILAKELDGVRSPAIDMIKKTLSKRDNDEITRLVKPIITYPSNKQRGIKNDSLDFSFGSRIEWDECKLSIRRGFDRLTRNIELIGETKDNLVVLRRYVNFSIVAMLLYLSQINAAAYKGFKPPVLIDAACNMESIIHASEQSYTAAKKAVEDYYVNVLQIILSKEEQVKNQDKECKKWIDGVAASKKDEEDKIREAIRRYYVGFVEDKDEPLTALAKALQIALYTFHYKSESPSDFCRVLGIRGGIVGPKGNRAVRKRYIINSFTLETLILSVLDADDFEFGIELKELGEKLINEYNIIIGANAEKEYTILEQANIVQSTPGNLRGDLGINAQLLASTLISLGLGRNYADGVTLIGWRL